MRRLIFSHGIYFKLQFDFANLLFGSPSEIVSGNPNNGDTHKRIRPSVCVCVCEAFSFLLRFKTKKKEKTNS